MSLSGLRRSAQKMGGGNKGKSKGGYYASWTPPSYNKIQGSVTPQEAPHVAEPIVLIEGEYADPFDQDKVNGQPTIKEAFHYRFHRYQQRYQNKLQFRMMSCLRGPESHNPKPCVPCLLTDSKEWDEKSHGARSGWVFNTAHLVAYHTMPLMKNGQIQTKQGTNQPIMVDRECRYGTIAQRVYSRSNNKPCEGCQQQAPTKLGGHRYWQVGKNHLEDLIDFNEKILGKVCFHTNTGIIQTGFICSKCGAKLVDLATSGLTNDQIKQFSESPYRCQCSHVGLPQAEYESGYGEGGFSRLPNFQMPVGSDGRPVKARPLNLFDVVLWVQREGESMDSKAVVTRWCRLTKFPSQNGEVDITQYVNETIVPNPFDFDDLFSIDTEGQAKILERPNPYSAAATQQNFARYGNPPGVPQGGAGYMGPTVPPPQPYNAPQMPGFMAPPQPPQGPSPQQSPIAMPYPQPGQFPAPIQPPQTQPAQPQTTQPVLPGNIPGFPPPGRPNW